MNSDWIKLHRKLALNDMWLAEPFTRGQAWVDLLILANYAPSEFVVRGITVRVEPGQLAYSEKRLASRWGWSRCKIRRFLGRLETDQKVIHQKSNVTSLISITNWSEYQEKRQQTGQQKDTRKTHNKKGKKKSSITEDSNTCHFDDQNDDESHPSGNVSDRIPHAQILDLFHRTCPNFPKVRILTDTRKTSIRQRWQQFANHPEGPLYAFEVVFAKASASDFLSGRNGRWTGCNFDWVVKQANFIKIAEGNYDNK